MKRLLSLLLTLLLAVPAHADTYELHTPGDDQLSRDQALAFANAFWWELCGVSIASSIQSGAYNASFGPGHQWGVETQEDCWVISVKDVEGPVWSLFLILHGTPGKSEDGSANVSVLYWSFRNRESMISYSCALPDATMIDRFAAVKLAAHDLAATAGVPESEIAFNNNGRFTLTKWAMRDNCAEPGDLDGDVPVWDLAFSTDALYASYLISAADGSVVYRSITEWKD